MPESPPVSARCQRAQCSARLKENCAYRDFTASVHLKSNLCPRRNRRILWHDDNSIADIEVIAIVIINSIAVDNY